MRQFDIAHRERRIVATVGHILAVCKSALYIGAKVSRMHHIGLLGARDVTILEAWPVNADEIWQQLTKPKTPDMRALLTAKSVNVITSDVRYFETDQCFDAVIWWHGPEHITEEELPVVLQKLERMANKLILLGCPWGNYPQHLDDNPYEDHLSHLQPEFFTRLGYQTETQGREGIGSNLMAWKIK